MKNDSVNLDLLRSFAVLLVVLSHIAMALGWGIYYEVEFIGRLGVVLFFVHTCLVLLMSLERTGETAAQFIVRRFFRIYPLAAVAVLLVAGGNAMGPSYTDWPALAANLLLVQNLTGHASTPPPLWSLPFEVQMYLTLPALFILARSARRIWLLWAASLSVVPLLWLFDWPFVHLVLWVPCFLAGVVAYTMMRGRAAVLPPAVLLSVVVGGVALCGVLQGLGVAQPPLYWALAGAVGLTIPLCRQPQSKLLARVGSVVARYSYGIYLAHLFALAFAFTFFPDLPAVARLGIAAVLLAAIVRAAYVCIEAPGIRLGARLVASSKRKPQVAPKSATIPPLAQ